MKAELESVHSPDADLASSDLLADHNEIGVIGLHRDRITDIEWMPTGDQVLTASFDGTARIWPVDIDLDNLRARARTRAYRSLTSEERSAHLLPAH